MAGKISTGDVQMLRNCVRPVNHCAVNHCEARWPRAVHVPCVAQGQGIGAGLLKDAILRTIQAADIAGIRDLAVHAKDENARRFYEHFGFIPSPTDALHLYLLVKDIKRLADN